jgi:hypothetical protein
MNIRLKQTHELLQANGHDPLITLKRFVSRAFGDMDVTVQVDWDPFHADSESASCGSGLLRQWAAEDAPSDADANLLLARSEGGGCGYVGGSHCVCSAAHITDTMRYQKTGTGLSQRNIHGCLHEIAHNLGVSHDQDETRVGDNHTGVGWNEHNTFFGFRLPWGGRWHRTPTVAGNGVTNACNVDIPHREYGSVVYHQYYTDCAKSAFRD